MEELQQEQLTIQDLLREPTTIEELGVPPSIVNDLMLRLLFNEGDVSYFTPLYIQTVAMLTAFPTHIAADAAYDAWYVYQTCAPRGGIAAVPPQPTCASRLRTRR